MESARERVDILNNIGDDSKGSCILVYLQLIAIPLLVFGYFVLSFFGFTSLPVHKHSIILMGIIFVTSLIFARHNAFYARCIFKLNMRGLNGRLKEYIMKNLLVIGKHKKSNSSFEIFMEEETKHIRNSNYSSVAASIFPTMGILGTFISIAISMPNFSSSTTGELEREIAVLLSGVGTAFYVSIYGILLSLWWIFYEKLGLSFFDKDVKRIKSNVRVFFWTKEEIEQAFLKENISHFQEIASIVSSLSNEKFLDKLSTSIDNKFQVFDKMLKLEEDAIMLRSKHTQESMNELKEAQEKQSGIGEVCFDILKTLDKFSKVLEEIEVKSFDNYNNIMVSQTSLNSTLKALNSSLEGNVGKLASVYEGFSSDLKSTQEKILDNFSKTLDSSLDKYVQDTQNAVEERYERLGKISVDSLKNEALEISKESEDIIKSLKDIK
ncbi:MAG: hypothetical protein CR967_00865 [Proteobacteria bacterium]|nr:MAG: hypothetical protein CR967_00865 [Pseudomonadota bacterium]